LTVTLALRRLSLIVGTLVSAAIVP